VAHLGALRIPKVSVHASRVRKFRTRGRIEACRGLGIREASPDRKTEVTQFRRVGTPCPPQIISVRADTSRSLRRPAQASLAWRVLYPSPEAVGRDSRVDHQQGRPLECRKHRPQLWPSPLPTMSSRAAVETAGDVSRAHLGAVGSQLRVPVRYALHGAVAQALLRSELPAPVSDEGCEIGRRDPACRTRTCGSWSSSHSRYTVAVHTPRCSATWRTVSSGGFPRRSGNNRVTNSLESDGKKGVAWDPASALTVRFDDGWGASGRVVDSPFADSEAEGHWFESSSARQHA